MLRTSLPMNSCGKLARRVTAEPDGKSSSTCSSSGFCQDNSLLRNNAARAVKTHLFGDVADVPSRPVVDDLSVHLEAEEQRSLDERHLALEPERRAQALDAPGGRVRRADQRVRAVHHRDQHVEHDNRRQADVRREHRVQQVHVPARLQQQQANSKHQTSPPVT